MDLARLIFILVVVVGLVINMKVDPRLGQVIMMGGAFGLIGIFGYRSFRTLKKRHTIGGDPPGQG